MEWYTNLTEYLYVFFDSPLKIINGILAFANLFILVSYILKFRISKNSPPLITKPVINSVLLISFLMIFILSIDEFFKFKMILASIASSGTGDPVVLAAGLAQFQIKILFHSALISFSLIAWFLLRVFDQIKNRTL
jgi:hypothetical protein